jgi:hypothetical protein
LQGQVAFFSILYSEVQPAFCAKIYSYQRCKSFRDGNLVDYIKRYPLTVVIGNRGQGIIFNIIIKCNYIRVKLLP